MSVRDLFGDDRALVAGSLIGFRCWASVDGFGRLRSTGVQYAWPRNSATHPDTAQCRGGLCGGQAPSARCGCGLYGWYSPADSRLVRGTVFGAIEATGRVQLGTHGFRAERARVLGVVTEYRTYASLLQRAGHRLFDSREALLEAYPAQDMTGLVNHRCTRRDCCDRLLASGRGLLPARFAAAAAAMNAGATAMHQFAANFRLVETARRQQQQE